MKINKRNIFILFLSILIPFIIYGKNIYTGSIPFWFDPARDLLLALENINKLSLIGPPSGIPGIFYGPYWIWLISVVLKVFSRDPRVVTFIVLFIPYLFIFPFYLFKLSDILGFKLSILLFLLFIFSYGQYVSYLWNPHLAPLILLILLVTITSINFNKLTKKENIQFFISGLLSGLLINFHISFGIGTLLGTLIFILIAIFHSKKRKWLRLVNLCLFIFGLIITFLPTIFFEFRHGFNQLNSFLTTITNAAIYNSAAVGQTGLKKTEIFQEFINIPSKLFLIPIKLFYTGLFIFIIILIIKYLSKTIFFLARETKLLLLIFSINGSLLFIYITSKNPVWQYHFIGFEVLYLLIIGWVVSKLKIPEVIITILIFIILFLHIYDLAKSWNNDPLKIPSLYFKESIVQTIFEDSRGKKFAFFAYSPSIYTYDYDYLFEWKKKSYPDTIIGSPKEIPTIYLIIPKADQSIVDDFVTYRTPDKVYKTDKIWKFDEGTIILKRNKII